MSQRLLDALAHAATRQYGGEPVTEFEHSLQCAELAESEGADEELVLACLLHDVGRYAVDQRKVYDSKELGTRPPAGGRGHHDLGADLIEPHVPPRVAWLVRMHADAKRYLCATEPGYYESLTPASKHTFALQGGEMKDDERTRLEAHPWLAAALRLRRWDDRAKIIGKQVQPLEHWRPLLEKYFA